MRQWGDRSIFDFLLVIWKELCEGLNEVVVGYFFSEGLSKLSKSFGEAETHFPWFVFSSSKKCSKGVYLIFLFAKIVSHRNEWFKTQHANWVLLVSWKLSENRHDFLNDMLLVKVSRELSQFWSTSPSNDRCIFLTELDEFLSEPFFLGVSPCISMGKQVARAHSTIEHLCLGKSQHSGWKNTLHFLVR